MSKLQANLIARKEIFRLWYEFYRLAQKSTDLKVRSALKRSSSFYAAWEVKDDEHFNDWWKTHQTLFQPEQLTVRIFEKTEVRTDSNLYVVIPKKMTHKQILEEVKALLAVEDPTARGKRRKLPPKHSYAPTEIQGVKVESLRQLLVLTEHVFVDPTLRGQALVNRVQTYFSKERYKRKENKIPSIFLGTDAHVSRNIRRYRDRSKKILLNVASGKFPGEY